MRELFRKKHQLWLQILFGAFALPAGKEREILYDFALIEFRHLKWIAKKILSEGLDFDWNRENFDIVHINSHGIYTALIDAIEEVMLRYKVGELYDRMRSDEEYMLFTIRGFLKNEPIAISAFDKKLHYEGLDEASKGALVEFLFEELYKEYELIVTYFYSAMHTKSVQLYSVFEDLIYESLYHLKSFALLLAKLGILALPRVVMREVYMFEDLEEFLQKGIEEEIAAKEQCKMLRDRIENEELSRFFDFINKQEDYHITLMKEALGTLKNA